MLRLVAVLLDISNVTDIHIIVICYYRHSSVVGSASVTSMWSRVAYIIISVFLNFTHNGITAEDCGDISTRSGYNNVTDIHIIGFFPCTNPNDIRGIPVDNCDEIERIPIMKLALEEINERCDLLPGYRLVVDYANSAVRCVLILYNSRPAVVFINSSNISSYPTN